MKGDLEDGDNSIAVPLSRAINETEMRNFFCDWLRKQALERYTVTQEEELADAKRPDLRFHGGGFDNPLPIELKIADKWTGNSLLERLENQLSRDYLRDAKSRYGIFLLVYVGNKHHWEINTQSFNFDELGSFLQHHADRFAETAEHMDKVKVICLDLTKRNKRLL